MRIFTTLWVGVLIVILISYGVFALLSPEAARSARTRSPEHTQSVDRRLKGDRLDAPAKGFAKQPTREPASHSLMFPPGCELPFSAILSAVSQAGRCAT